MVSVLPICCEEAARFPFGGKLICLGFTPGKENYYSVNAYFYISNTIILLLSV